MGSVGAHGVTLVDRVVAEVREEPERFVVPRGQWAGPWLSAGPAPVPAEVLAGLTFPSGRPLPPSLRRWLAFDASMLTRFGWFAADGAYRFTPRPIDQFLAAGPDRDWAAFYRPLSARFGECFVLPGASDRLCVLAAGEPDEIGEYPGLALTTPGHGPPAIELMYPGFDVWLAEAAGVVRRLTDSPVALAGSEAYGARMRTHAQRTLGGRLGASYPEPPFVELGSSVTGEVAPVVTDAASGLDSARHGAALVDRVIEVVAASPNDLIWPYLMNASTPNPIRRSDWGPWVEGEPTPMPPDVLAGLTFPSGRPLPPSLRRWLAFDTSLLTRCGWFAPDGGYRFTPRPLHEVVGHEAYAAIGFDECFLLPGGGDSRRVLAVGEPDEYGEYPVLVTDVDDLPYIAVMYPGLDVFLAHAAGLLGEADGYCFLEPDRTYGARIGAHARHLFAGQTEVQWPDPIFGDEDATEEARGAVPIAAPTPIGHTAPYTAGPTAPAVAPIGSLTELAEEVAAWSEDPTAVERALAALVAFAHADRIGLQRALAPVMARDRWGASSGEVVGWLHCVLDDTGHDVPLSLRAAAVAAAAAPAQPPTPAPGWFSQTFRQGVAGLPAPSRAITYRFREIARGLAHAPVPALVSTPTTTTGHLDPADLLHRLARAAADGWQPWPYDLQQALLRLPRGTDPGLAARARRLGTAAAQQLADHLTTGGLPDPALLRTRLADLQVPGIYHLWTSFHKPHDIVLATTPPDMPPTPIAGGPTPSLAGMACDLSLPAAATGNPVWIRGWPWLLPSHPDVIAAHLVPWAAAGVQDRRGRPGADLLPHLAAADAPVGVGLTLALAYGLGAADATSRTHAVQAVRILIDRGRLDAAALGAELAALTATGVLALTRLTPALRETARADGAPQTWTTVATMLPRLLSYAKPPTGLADLLALAADLAERVNPTSAIDGLSAVATRGGSSRLGTEARRLHHQLSRPA